MFLATVEGLWSTLRASMSHVYLFVASLGGPGLFFIALADSSFLSLPEGNDLLIVVLSTGQTWGTMTYYVVMTILGSVCGCAALYSVGRRGGAFLRKRLQKDKLREVERLYGRWGIWAIVVPSVLPPPTPFKIFVLSAGLFRISWVKFLLSVAVGRSIRYFMWGALAVLYGELAKRFLEENLPVVGTVLFLLFVTAMVSYAIMWLRAKRKSPQHEIA